MEDAASPAGTFRHGPAGRPRPHPADLSTPTTHRRGRTHRTGVRACWQEANATRFVTLVPGNGRVLSTLDALKGGETVEFVGHSREWHGLDGTVCWTVVVNDMDVVPPTGPRPQAESHG